jgi:hypothetical protein
MERLPFQPIILMRESGSMLTVTALRPDRKIQRNKNKKAPAIKRRGLFLFLLR